jgi:hypothetical protein
VEAQALQSCYRHLRIGTGAPAQALQDPSALTPLETPPIPGRLPSPRLLTTFYFLHTLKCSADCPLCRTTGHHCGFLMPPQVQWPLFLRFRLDLYGKSKKSTHGHQNVNPSGLTFFAAGPKRCAFSRRFTEYPTCLPVTPVAAAIRVEAGL